MELVVAVGEDHANHRRVALLAEEHVLGAAQPDALGTEFPGASSVRGRVGVGADPEPAQLVRPLQDLHEVLSDLGLDQLHVVGRDRARGAVDRDQVALVEDRLPRLDGALREVDLQL